MTAAFISQHLELFGLNGPGQPSPLGPSLNCNQRYKLARRILFLSAVCFLSRSLDI